MISRTSLKEGLGRLASSTPAPGLTVLIYHRIGGIPSPGDEVRVDGLRLTVESTDGRRVGKVLVSRERTDDEASDEDGDR